MNIDYQNGRLKSKQVDFEGETEDGKGFTIDANWNDWDDWSVDDITWHDEEGTPEQVIAIQNKFLEDMN
jgi:hypothetical protein